MDNAHSTLDSDANLKVLLAEYNAIERMHAHYDVLNMSMTAIITAGVFTIWSIVVQSAFQPHAPINNPLFVNSVSVLALLLFAVLSVWIRYVTVHRCIVIRKLSRSHEIEKQLQMRQNLIFRYDPERFRAPITSDKARRRPGGHTLELLLYLALSIFGVIIAFLFQWHIQLRWTLKSYILIAFLGITPLFAILWMTFCKLDAIVQMEGEVEVGLPWNLLFSIAEPINKSLRRLANLWPRSV